MHNVESMFYVRQVPWHGLGVNVEKAPTSEDALHFAGLDWRVEQTPVFTDSGIEIPGYKANRRDTDGTILGIVSDRYKIVQTLKRLSLLMKLLVKRKTEL